MRFEEAQGGWTESRLTQEEAALLLGVCARTFCRYIDRYEDECLEGLIDKRLSQVSHRRAPVDEVMRLDRYHNRYRGWTVKHYQSSFQDVRDVIEGQGLFCSLYMDRGSHDWTTPAVGGKVDKVNLTRFGRTMSQLGIEMIPACSPEAQGRSERVFSRHQNRLVKELALAGITDMATANEYLIKTYLPAYNAEFTQPPPEQGSAFVACRDLTVLDDILCERFERTVRKDNGVHFDGLVLQSPADRHRGHYVKAKVKVLRYTDNTRAIHHGPRELARYDAQGQKIPNELPVAA